MTISVSAEKPKRKYHDSNRTYVSLSFSVPAELEDPMNQAAVNRGMNRSQYIVWLVERDLYMQNATKQREFMPEIGAPARHKAPPRIRRGKSKPPA